MYRADGALAGGVSGIPGGIGGGPGGAGSSPGGVGVGPGGASLVHEAGGPGGVGAFKPGKSKLYFAGCVFTPKIDALTHLSHYKLCIIGYGAGGAGVLPGGGTQTYNIVNDSKDMSEAS